jgi:hypothetical protein
VRVTVRSLCRHVAVPSVPWGRRETSTGPSRCSLWNQLCLGGYGSSDKPERLDGGAVLPALSAGSTILLCSKDLHGEVGCQVRMQRASTPRASDGMRFLFSNTAWLHLTYYVGSFGSRANKTLTHSTSKWNVHNRTSKGKKKEMLQLILVL